MNNPNKTDAFHICFKMHALVLQLSILLVIITCIDAVYISKYSNLHRIQEIQAKLHNCMTDAQEKKIAFRLLYLLAIEGVNLTLECNPCLANNGTSITWSKLTFENFQTEVKRPADSMNDNLMLSSPESDLSTYYCSWVDENIKEIVNNIWTIEIIHANKLQRTTSMIWNESVPFRSIEDNLIVTVRWQEWSPCSKCDKVGKRHRLGSCSVKILDKRKPNVYQALDVYRFGLSCSLFINLHPDVIEISPKLARKLGGKPYLMIGYCKVPCGEKEYQYSTTTFLEYPDALKDLYQNNTQSNYESNNEKKSAIEVIQGLKDIPISSDFIPEILAVLILCFIQVYILIKVCKYRRKAR